MPGQHQHLHARCIVSYHGVDTGSGVWKCSKDRTHECIHINFARDHLQKLITSDPSAIDGRGGPNVAVAPGTAQLFLVFMIRQAGLKDIITAPHVRRGGSDERPISHLPILPPAWASLPTDTLYYTRPSPFHVAPTAIPLNDDSICRCGTPYDSTLPSTEQLCTIYGLSRTYSSRVGLQICPSSCKASKNRGISPETRHLGLFNFNGRILLAHDLLDEYTSAYTSSETPFVAWVTVVARRYALHSSEKQFLSDEMFRAVWFSYVRLQQFGRDMECPECGPTPDTVIWDGVTLAFSRKHLLSTLRPPTTLDVDSPVRKAKYQSQQQLLLDTTLRKLVRKIISGPPLPSDILNKDLEGGGEKVLDGRQRKGDGNTATATIMEQIEGIESACDHLKKINQGLGDLFEENYGLGAYLSKRKVASVFRELFVQVSTLNASSFQTGGFHLQWPDQCRRVCPSNDNSTCPSRLTRF